tara:strand:- start:4214 stop:4648 length:435 start_codon:yes stop_codon:yes gene_type:complete
VRQFWIAAAAILPLAVGLALIGVRWVGQEAAERVALGQTVYNANCAGCHGAKLEGQPNWRSPGVDGRLPAPPHDVTGHTWHHSDAQLFAITKNGTAAVVGGGYESNMPGFGEVLTSAEIEAVLDYIKSTWPRREAEYQLKASSG